MAEINIDKMAQNVAEKDIDDVDAWMPLPEPYKTESEDKE